MKHLLRHSSQGNGIIVVEDEVPSCIRKMSSDPHGISCLKREEEGMKWYAQRMGNSNPVAVSYSTPEYKRLDIAKYSGRKPCYKTSFLKNSNILKSAIDHYVAVWPREVTAPVHGDLTLDNVIITDAGIRFYDWEHFSLEPYPWGFDALYCLLSALLLPLKKDEMPDKESYKVFIDYVFCLFDKGLSPDIAEYPLQKMRNIFVTTPCWATILAKSPHKLLPFLYDELYCDIIDDYITRRIRHHRYDNFKKSISNNG